RLLGDFALALFDPAQRKLLLARDPIGVRPLYYYQAKHTFLFASEIKALLTHPDRPRKPNEDVLAWYVLRQPGMDTRWMTFFEGVFHVRPGYLVTVTPERTLSQRFWDCDRPHRIRLKTFEDYAEAFQPILER